MMWGFGGGWIWMVIFWGVVIGAIVWAIVRTSPTSGRGDDTSSARRILDERYARGEIEQDEYRRLRDELAR